MTELKKITDYLDKFLNINAFKDYSQNGLQVDGKNTVKRIVGLVDASLDGFIAAADSKADMIIVHHGILWGKPISLTGIVYDRIKTLIDENISLYASHLPLDAHPELGNNAQLAHALNAEIIDWFAEYGGKPIGCIAKFKNKRPLAEVITELDTVINTQSRVFDFGDEEIQTIGIVSGAACDALPDAVTQNVDLFITGEPRLSAFHEAREFNINVAFAGHYATECVGIQALINHLPTLFDVETLFIDVPCDI